MNIDNFEKSAIADTYATTYGMKIPSVKGIGGLEECQARHKMWKIRTVVASITMVAGFLLILAGCIWYREHQHEFTSSFPPDLVFAVLECSFSFPMVVVFVACDLKMELSQEALCSYQGRAKGFEDFLDLFGRLVGVDEASLASMNEDSLRTLAVNKLHDLGEKLVDAERTTWNKSPTARNARDEFYSTHAFLYRLGLAKKNRGRYTPKI